MSRLAVTGCRGQVALSLLNRAPLHRGIDVVALGRPALDLERPDEIRDALAAARPDVVVNAAAYTAVDRAETEEALAMAINRDGAAAVAAAAQSLGLPLIQISTDYVYDGRKGTPYVESDKTEPLNVYGRSKLEGEVAVRRACPEAVILRTAWVFSPFSSNFVKTMLRLGAERPLLRVVDDQWGNPTSALDLADALLRLTPAIRQGEGLGGTYHLAGSGHASWYELACEVFSLAAHKGLPTPRVEAIPTSAYPTPAARPADTRLSLQAFVEQFGFSLPPWRVGLEHVLSAVS